MSMKDAEVQDAEVVAENRNIQLKSCHSGSYCCIQEKKPWVFSMCQAHGDETVLDPPAGLASVGSTFTFCVLILGKVILKGHQKSPRFKSSHPLV
jgi:hypothetical protein